MKFIPGYTDFFMSPITGKVTYYTQLPGLQNFYVFEGDRAGNASPSPALIDIRLDIIELRRLIDNSNYLPENYIYRGNASDIATPYQTILLSNMADLSEGRVWVGNSSGRPVESSFYPLGSELPEGMLFRGNSDNVAVPVQIIGLNNLPLLNLTGVDNPYGSGKIGQIYEGTELGIPIVSNILGNIVSTANSLQNQINDINSDISDIRSDINDIEDDIFDIQSDISDIEFDITIIEGDITAINGEIAIIQGQITVLEGEISALTAAVAANTTAIAAVNTRIDNLRLNDIPADDDVSIDGNKLIDVGYPSDPTDGANKQFVLDAVSEGISGLDITLEGFIEGGPAVGGVLETYRGPDCVLNNIPATNDVSFSGYRITDIGDAVEEFDGISQSYLWRFLNNDIEVAWA